MNKASAVIAVSLAALLAACGQKEEQPAADMAAPEAAAAAVAEPAPSEAAVAATPANEAGEKTYKTVCSMCHASGTAGAPIPGNKADWEARIAQGTETLYKHAIEGFTGAKGVMPAKGGMTSLSDDDVKAAVDYMVAKSG
jgi:cytochrome c5